MKADLLLLAAAAVLASCSGEVIGQPDIIPAPNEIEVGGGTFVLEDGMCVSYTEDFLAPAAGILSESFRKSCGYDIMTVKGDAGDVVLEVSSVAGGTPGAEGAYRLEVRRTGITVTGDSYDGVANGISTLRQLVPRMADRGASGAGTEIVCCEITDSPRFAWRGAMLDVARHFFTKDEVKQLLDVMSFYKLNKLHWHLTDDQGWRVEIKEYPLLAEKGAWRHFDRNDRFCMAAASETGNLAIPEDRIRIAGRDTLYGGYYTREDIMEIVGYARERGIDIVPEVDMPGHMLAAIDNYPWLACGDDTGWGELFSCPICPGKDEVLDFCRNVYSEIFEMFPYSYVHIGGDEVDRSNWAVCPACRTRMEEHGLETTAELQSWFIHEMEAFFTANGRKLICWDEGIAGGLSETATVMWWRSWSPGPVAGAAASGTPVIACPNAVFYLDYAQDSKSMGNIYAFDSTAVRMFGPHTESLLGVQGNLWAEKVPSAERMQYMMFPRLLAVAELGWSSPEVKSFESFNGRAVSHLGRLEDMGVEYRIPDLEGFHDVNAFSGSTVLDITCRDPQARIFYTTDGSVPDMSSAEYTGPMTVDCTTSFTFRTFGPDGRQGDIRKTEFRKEETAAPASPGKVERGLQADWHDYGGGSCLEIGSAPLNGSHIVGNVSIPDGVSGNIGLIIKGYIEVPEDGVYTFRLLSDDGSFLKIDGRKVVDNDGEHSPYEKTGQKVLGKGLHALEVRYFDHNGGLLEMSVYGPDGKLLVPEEIYFH